MEGEKFPAQNHNEVFTQGTATRSETKRRKEEAGISVLLAADDFEAGGNKFTTVFFGVGCGGGGGRCFSKCN